MAGAALRIFLAFAGILATTRLAAAQVQTDEIWSETNRLEVGGSQVWCVAYSLDFGKRIGHAGSGGTVPRESEIKLWDAGTGQVLFAIKTPALVRCVAFAPDGKALAVAELGGPVQLRNAATGEVLITDKCGLYSTYPIPRR